MAGLKINSSIRQALEIKEEEGEGNGSYHQGNCKRSCRPCTAIQDRQNNWLSNVQLDTSRIFSEFEYCHTPESQQQQQPQQPE